MNFIFQYVYTVYNSLGIITKKKTRNGSQGTFINIMQEVLNIKPNNERPHDTYLQRRYSTCFMSNLETEKKYLICIKLDQTVNIQ